MALGYAAVAFLILANVAVNEVARNQSVAQPSTSVLQNEARGVFILCTPNASLSSWLSLPTTAGGPATVLRLASYPTLCAVPVQPSHTQQQQQQQQPENQKGQGQQNREIKRCSGAGCLGLGSCANAPKFELRQSKRYPSRGSYNLALVANASPNIVTNNSAGTCIDAMGCFQVSNCNSCPPIYLLAAKSLHIYIPFVAWHALTCADPKCFLSGAAVQVPGFCQPRLGDKQQWGRDTALNLRDV